jgi:metal-dependent amidase/aminoacylase/carboxypeptidase family protein
MGESIDPHDKVILADTDRVSNAIARGICKAFNVNFDIPVPSPVPPQVDNSLLITQLRNTISEKNDTINRLTAESITLKAKIIKYETLLDQIARNIEAVRI